jgi:hypothetical protein
MSRSFDIRVLSVPRKATLAPVVRQHKTIISEGLDLAVRMLSELKATTTHVGELEAMLDDDKTKRAGMYRAISVPTRITALRDFATACRTLVGLERQAFSIIEEKEPPPPPEPEPRTLEELRVALLAKMEEFGLSPFDLTEPIGTNGSGVANRRRRAGTEH